MRPLKILVADDEEGIRYSLGEYLRRRGSEVTIAADGAEALEYFQSQDFDILLTDLIMPRMGGLDLIHEVRQLRPLTVCMILTGHGSRDDAIEAMREGVFEFIDKPVLHMAELGMAIDRAGAQARLLREREILLADLKRKNVRLEVSLAQLNDVYNRVLRQEEILEADLRQAQRMQKCLLPSAFPPLHDIEVFGYFCPCERLGGDFFGMIPLGVDRMAIYLADVAGHGVGAAMVTVIVRELIHAHRILHPDSRVFEDPGQALAFINKGLCDEDFDPPVLVTMIYAVIDGARSEVRCSCAGHPAPLLCMSGRRTRYLNARGPVLGIYAADGATRSDFAGNNEFAVETVALEGGDSLLLYSDGITEARDGGENELGPERLSDTLCDTHGLPPAEVGEELESALFRHVGSASRADDMTFLVLARTGSVVSSHRRASVKIVRPDEFQVASPRAEGRVAAGWTGGTCVVRLSGKATWQQGHALRETFRHARSRPADSIHVDLASCQSVDSTVIGILYERAGDIIVHGAEGRIAHVFEELGVIERFRMATGPAPDAILTHIDPVEVSRSLVSDMILRAHESLMQVSDANRDRFSPVVDALRKTTRAADESSSVSSQ